jgi:hypothetical protein
MSVDREVQDFEKLSKHENMNPILDTIKVFIINILKL